MKNKSLKITKIRKQQEQKQKMLSPMSVYSKKKRRKRKTNGGVAVHQSILLMDHERKCANFDDASVVLISDSEKEAILK